MTKARCWGPAATHNGGQGRGVLEGALLRGTQAAHITPRPCAWVGGDASGTHMEVDGLRIRGQSSGRLRLAAQRPRQGRPSSQQSNRHDTRVQPGGQAHTHWCNHGPNVCKGRRQECALHPWSGWHLNTRRKDHRSRACAAQAHACKFKDGTALGVGGGRLPRGSVKQSPSRLHFQERPPAGEGVQGDIQCSI